MKKTILSILFLSASIITNAQDKALLETLVKRGMLTQQEATQIAKDTVSVTPATKSTKSISIFGGATGWYTFAQDTLKTSNTSIPQTCGFELRYVKIGMQADIGSGWSAKFLTDFGTEGASRNYLDEVTISKNLDYDYLKGTLQLGLRKANMGYEQNTDDFQLLTIERSVATRFFTSGSYGDASKNFGNRTIGVFWESEIEQVKGLYYTTAITSGLSESTQDFITLAENSSLLSFYASIGYKKTAEFGGEDLSYDFGINLGYAPDGMYVNGDTQGDVWGINPYATANWNNFTIIAEFFLQQYQDYTSNNGHSRTPIGANLTLAYKLDIGQLGAIEPVMRWSYVYANAGSLLATSEFSDIGFNQATTYFLGVNWYAMPSVKTSLGYEFGYFDGGENGERMFSNSLRAQLQVLF